MFFCVLACREGRSAAFFVCVFWLLSIGFSRRRGGERHDIQYSGTQQDGFGLPLDTAFVGGATGYIYTQTHARKRPWRVRVYSDAAKASEASPSFFTQWKKHLLTSRRL